MHIQRLFTIVTLLISSVLFAQSADDIIKNNLEKTGGEKAWNNLNSIILRGSVSFNLETSYPMVIRHKRPYLKKVSFVMDGKEILNEGYDGKYGWTYNEISKKNIVIPDYKPDAFDSDLLKYKQKGFNVKLVGKEKYEGGNCYRIELAKNKNISYYCFDEKTYQLVFEENKDEVLYYSDYKNFSGLAFATKIVGKPKEGGEYIIRFNTIQINPPIDSKVFNFK